MGRLLPLPTGSKPIACSSARSSMPSVLPGAKGAPIDFFMYPQGEMASGRLDCLDPDAFKYTITAKEVAA
jgi:hypothetical protein